VSIEKFRKCVDNDDILGALLAIETLEDVNDHCPHIEKLTPLGYALGKKSYEVAQSLIFRGADVNAKDYNSWTALHLAVRTHEPKHVKFLLEHGANPKQKDDRGLEPMHYAGMSENAEIIQLLLEAGASIPQENLDNSAKLFLLTHSDTPCRLMGE